MQNTDITIRQRDTYKQSYTQTNKRTERHKYIQGNIHTGRQTYRQAYAHMTNINTQRYIQTIRQAYIIAGIHTYIQICSNIQR